MKLDLVKDFLPAYSIYAPCVLTPPTLLEVLSSVAASERQTRVAGKLMCHVAVLVTQQLLPKLFVFFQNQTNDDVCTQSDVTDRNSCKWRRHTTYTRTIRDISQCNSSGSTRSCLVLKRTGCSSSCCAFHSSTNHTFARDDTMTHVINFATLSKFSVVIKRHLRSTHFR